MYSLPLELAAKLRAGDAYMLVLGADTIDDDASEHILSIILKSAALGGRYPRVESVCSNSLLQGFRSESASD
tara:strand:- start:16476 stop:16691 length:216 start_codon:yes stop_codon:yes gene_type:complete